MNILGQVGEGAEKFAAAVLSQLPYVLAGIAALIIFVLLSRAIRAMVRRARWIEDDSLRTLISGIAAAVMIVVGVFVALWIAIPSVSFSELLASVGVSGIVLGFALRDIIENFVAGIIILARRPFGVGDQIRSGDYEGTVQEINFSSTVLKTYDGLKVYIPNGQLLTDPVENLTGYQSRRSEVSIGIHQDASVAEARKVIISSLADMEEVLADPEPQVFFRTIADSTNNLDVLYWTNPPTRFHQRSTASDVTERLYDTLREAGIEFPYPITSVQIERTA
ncbi:MAG: mechanosensitive ion channel family protein [Candidatus Limnocylindria bacterium]